MVNNFDITSIPVQMLILLTLKSGDKYGYEIKDGIDNLTDGQIEIKQASLYTSLKKLEQTKLISSYWRDSDIGGKRHYYFLTDAGKEEIIRSDIEKILSESLKQKTKEDNVANSVEFFDKDSEKSGGGFFANQGVGAPMAEPIVKDEVQPTITQSPTTSAPISTFTNEKLESHDLTPEIVSEEVLNKKNAVATAKSDENVFVSELPRYESEDVVSKSKKQAQMQNTDIDYKNILGELYSPESSIENAELSEPVIKVQETPQSPVSIDEEKVIHQEKVSEPVVSCENTNSTSDEKYINKIINRSVKVSNYSNFGINVKRHSKASEVSRNTDNFYKISSLRFMESVFLYLLIALEICVAFLFVRNSGSILYSDFKIFAIIGGIFALYPILCLVFYLLNPNKKKKIEFNFTNSLIYRVLTTFIFIMFVIAMNFLFGMTNLNQADYIIFWLLPSLLSLNIVFEIVIYKLLLLSGKYNC